MEQRLDTLIHFDTGTTAAWNYDLANGDYLVTLASGDPNWSQGPHTVAVEGTTVIDGVSTSANEFITITEQPVTVTDGQLTVQLTRSGTAKTILNYVVITSAGSGPGDAPPSAPGPVSTSGVTASSVTVNWGVASDDVGVAEYEVARCTGAGCTTYSVLATVAHPTVTYTDTTVGASTTYGYQVVAKDTAGQVGPAVVSGDVTTASASDAPPSAPGPVSTSGVTASSVTVNWGVASGYGCASDGDIYRHDRGSEYAYGYQVVAKDTAGQVGPAVVSGDVTTECAPECAGAVSTSGVPR